MPTLTSQEPDTLDLDFFYKNVSETYGSYGVAIYEVNPLIVKPIQKNFYPTTCFDTNLPENDKTYNSPQDSSISPTTSNKQIKNLIRQLNTTQQTIPPSPSSQHKSTLTNPTNLSSPSPSLHIHTCPKCWHVISCKMANSQHYPQGDVIKERENYYHSKTLSTKNIYTSSMEIDLPTNFQDSPATNQFLNKDTNQTQPTSTQSQNLLLNEPKPKPNPSYD
ncbi:7182_t:CDS:2, partial [Gigaspora rosea]